MAPIAVLGSDETASAQDNPLKVLSIAFHPYGDEAATSWDHIERIGQFLDLSSVSSTGLVGSSRTGRKIRSPRECTFSRLE